MPIDAKGIRQAERNLPTGADGNARRRAEGRLGFRAIEEVPLEIDNARGANEGGVDLRLAQLRTDAKKSIHRALPVGRDEDQGPPRGFAADAGWRRFECYTRV